MLLFPRTFICYLAKHYVGGMGWGGERGFKGVCEWGVG